MNRRLFTGLAAATAVAASLLITAVTPAAAQTPTASTTADARGGGSGSGGSATPYSKVPDGLQVKDATLKVVATLRGVGSQIYECKTTGGPYTLREPVATLSTSRGGPVGIHGLGPFWANVDGSKVSGTAPVSDLKIAGPGNVPWLLVTGKDQQGQGVFSKVKFIQRLDTRGGVAPTGTCTAGSTAAVGYSANYVFWAPK